MKKVKERDLVIGDEYYLDESKYDSGIFVGVFDGDFYFYPTKLSDIYEPDGEGLIGFWEDDYEYEEVE